MTEFRRRTLLVLGLATLIGCGTHSGNHENGELPSKSKPAVVSYVHPKTGVFERHSTQPGSVQAYESVNLYAKVPGFLKTQSVDIGDVVKLGQVLAVLDVPELVAQMQRAQAGVDQAKSKVTQMKARVATTIADSDAAKSAVVQAEASHKSASAWVRYRGLQHKRMKELFTTRSIEEKLVDEAKERYEASVETERSAEASIETTKANVKAAEAKIDAARADQAEAESQVKLTEADLTRANVLVGFATVTAPFDGVVTHRSLFPGDFVRSANEGGTHEPLLTVQRTDLMRVIVMIPDRDVPYVSVGNHAVVELDALRDQSVLKAKVSRIARSEDSQTRLMRVEIDLPNPTGKISNGMYGKVTITLDQAQNQLSIPSACLVGKAENSVGSVFVVRDKKAHLVRIRLGPDNGVRVAVVNGLSADDQVIVQPGNTLSEGTPVTATNGIDRSDDHEGTPLATAGER